MSANSNDNLPYFQQLQKQFAGHIRNPQNTTYAPAGQTAIEPRRLQAYQELFFNNLEGFFSQMFPVCVEVLGSERWMQIIREYMIKHNSRTPLFHELGEEFLGFLQSEFEPVKSDPVFLLELAHYEWVELALSVSTDVGFSPMAMPEEGLSLDAKYRLSPLAWPLAYEWPVHQLSKAFQPIEKPLDVTTLLVYRHQGSAQDGSVEDFVDFMTLTPLLYQWLMALDEAESARTAFESIAEDYQLTPELLEDVLKDLFELNVLQPIR